MIHVVLYQPEIPPNTGNIIRLCANTGSHLHLIYPLGFELDDKRLRRAGLDYRDMARVSEYNSLDEFVATVNPGRVFGVSTRGSTRYDQVEFRPDDALLFGPETRGLPQQVLDDLPSGQRLRVPMRAAQRSMNLSNCTAILVYEAWKQFGFEGGA